MSSNPLVSVIIPVYGVEKYLNQCVDSVLAQKLDSYEIILVDDGSPDACPQICDAYAASNPHIKVIHKPNGGLSSARNAGIDAATGEYLIFMDSDDWWNDKVSVRDMLSRVCAQPQVDMFLFTSLDYVEGKGYYKREEHKRLDAVSTDSVPAYYADLLNNGNLEVSACTKIFKKAFLKEQELYFKPGIVSEDCEWMLRVLRKLTAVGIINESLYICRLGRADSITNSIKKKNIVDLLNIVQSSVEYYANSDVDKSLMPYEFCYCSYLWFSALGLSQKLKKSERKEMASLFEQTKAVCAYSNSAKTKLCLHLYRLCGYRITGWILGRYIALKSKVSINKTMEEKA